MMFMSGELGSGHGAQAFIYLRQTEENLATYQAELRIGCLFNMKLQ
jgi:hypothetical protein